MGIYGQVKYLHTSHVKLKANQQDLHIQLLRSNIFIQSLELCFWLDGSLSDIHCVLNQFMVCSVD